MSADFVERIYPANNSPEVLEAARDRLRAQGATWLRFHVSTRTGQLVCEGWKERPDDEGPLPDDEP